MAKQRQKLTLWRDRKANCWRIFMPDGTQIRGLAQFDVEYRLPTVVSIQKGDLVVKEPKRQSATVTLVFDNVNLLEAIHKPIKKRVKKCDRYTPRRQQ